jgi:hypothetical protein
MGEVCNGISFVGRQSWKAAAELQQSKNSIPGSNGRTSIRRVEGFRRKIALFGLQ